LELELLKEELKLQTMLVQEEKRLKRSEEQKPFSESLAAGPAPGNEGQSVGTQTTLAMFFKARTTNGQEYQVKGPLTIPGNFDRVCRGCNKIFVNAYGRKEHENFCSEILKPQIREESKSTMKDLRGAVVRNLLRAPHKRRDRKTPKFFQSRFSSIVQVALTPENYSRKWFLLQSLA
jgi:hypothetical protein